MNIIDCVQGSAEWLAERCGRVTASRICDVTAMLKKGGETAARANYRAQIVAELLTGTCADHFVSDAMTWGIEQEQFARVAYEMHTGYDVDQVGLIVHPTIERASASPDGLVGKEGGLEIKCPNTTTHIKWLLTGEVPEEHIAQMLFNMACSGRKWWDFASFDPRLPKRYQLFVKRLPRNDALIAGIEDSVRQFLAEVDATIDALKAIAPEQEQPQQPEPEWGITDADILAVDSSYRPLTSTAPPS